MIQTNNEDDFTCQKHCSKRGIMFLVTELAIPCVHRTMIFFQFHCKHQLLFPSAPKRGKPPPLASSTHEEPTAYGWGCPSFMLMSECCDSTWKREVKINSKNCKKQWKWMWRQRCCVSGQPQSNSAYGLKNKQVHWGLSWGHCRHGGSVRKPPEWICQKYQDVIRLCSATESSIDFLLLLPDAEVSVSPSFCMLTLISFFRMGHVPAGKIRPAQSVPLSHTADTSQPTGSKGRMYPGALRDPLLPPLTITFFLLLKEQQHISLANYNDGKWFLGVCLLSVKKKQKQIEPFCFPDSSHLKKWNKTLKTENICKN